MPLVYQQNINEHTRLGVWHITEMEDFFLQQVPLQREISHPHKRLQHLAGRLLLKELFADFPYELIRIADTRKPFLENEAYHFSISHCGNYAAVIVSKKNRVGVDTELFNPKVDKIKHKFLSDAEQKIITGIADDQSLLNNLQLLIAAWSIKETIYKWAGDGQVDFKDHIHIEKIIADKNGGTAYCKFLKEVPVELMVQFVFFSDTCLAWISG